MNRSLVSIADRNWSDLSIFSCIFIHEEWNKDVFSVPTCMAIHINPISEYQNIHPVKLIHPALLIMVSVIAENVNFDWRPSNIYTRKSFYFPYRRSAAYSSSNSLVHQCFRRRFSSSAYVEAVKSSKRTATIVPEQVWLSRNL